MIGSACFALGAAPGYGSAVGVKADGITYFVGSLFFTSAAFLQFREARPAPASIVGRHRSSWSARCSSTFSTADALITNLSAKQSDQQIWRPDALGSICFLVASELALIAVGKHWISWMPAPQGLVDRGAEHGRFDRVRRVGGCVLRHRR